MKYIHHWLSNSRQTDHTVVNAMYDNVEPSQNMESVRVMDDAIKISGWESIYWVRDILQGRSALLSFEYLVNWSFKYIMKRILNSKI